MFAACFLLLISVFASKSTSGVEIPILLIFIVIGMLGGIEGPRLFGHWLGPHPFGPTGCCSFFN